MELDTLDALLSPAGGEILAAAAALAPTDATYPACFDRLAKRFPAPLARAALDTILLRRKAAAKFAGADRMFFDREALEMASGDVAARHRAERFHGFGPVADLGCGIGGDAMALTTAGVDVVCVDHDPVRLRMAEANLQAHGRTARFACDDVLTLPLADCRSAFADPGRRPGGARVLSLDACEPPVAAIIARFPAGFRLAVKVAPGVARSELARFDADAEFVSVGGELKECVLWFGDFRTGKPTATILPGPHTLTGDPGDLYDSGPVEAGGYLYDPDPAVVRADLMLELATRLAARPLEVVYALLTSATFALTPFATAYRIEDVLPLDAKVVGGWLRQRGVGRVTVLKRGMDVDVDALARKWRTDSDESRVVVLCRAGGRRVAVICTVHHRDTQGTEETTGRVRTQNDRV